MCIVVKKRKAKAIANFHSVDSISPIPTHTQCAASSSVIGCLCAVSVAVVAALTLSVALPLALRTIDDNSEAAVLALGRTAATALDHVLRVPADSVTEAGERILSMDSHEGLPSEDLAYNRTTGAPAVSQLRQKIHSMAKLGEFSYFVTGITTADGMSGWGYHSYPFFFEIQVGHPTGSGLQRTVSVHDNVTGLFNATMTAFSTEVFKSFAVPIPGTYAESGYRAAWAKWRVGSHPDGAAVWGPPVIFASADSITMAHTVSSFIRNASGILGLAYIMFDVAGTAKLLNAARLSPGTQVFLYDKDLYLVSASAGLRTYTLVNFTGHDESNGCTTTQASEYLSVSVVKRRTCRFHLSGSPHNALTDAFGALPSVFARPATGGEIHQVKGRFVFVQPLAVVRHGFTMSLVVLTPRADFLGDASKIVPATLGVAGLAVVVAATAAFVLVRVVLSPLQGIAARMGRAARLEEDDEGEAVSPLAEVGDLQRAFFLLKNELARIRAFVPQSLLRAQSGDDDDLEDGDDSPPAHDCCLTTLPHESPKAALNLSTGVRQESVSILVLNLRGFHRATAAGLAAEAMAELVATVLEVAQQEKGVVDAFNGDRFFVSFNAARMAAGHSIRAARVACRVAAALSTEASGRSYQLPVTAGISTGTAQVGNLGSSTMKRFSIIGPVVSQAAVLERMCKLYDGVRCLVPQRLFEDLHTAVRLETVDYVRLPGARGSRGILVASVMAELNDATDDEWMYQLEQQGACGNKRQSACAASNAATSAAWTDLVAGRVDEAAVKVQASQSSVDSVGAALSLSEWIAPRTTRDQIALALSSARVRESAGLAPPLLPTTLGPFYAAATETW